MAFPIDPEWKLNIKTEDIVYPFVDDTKTIYRKRTAEICLPDGETIKNSTIVEIRISGERMHSERTLTDAEMTVEQFDAIKDWSDAEYKSEVCSFMSDHRTAVANVSDLEDCPTIAYYEKFAGDEDVETDYRTIENAVHILNAMKMTEKQQQRFDLYVKGLSTYKIAKLEGIDHKSVWRSLQAVEKKRQKAFSKFFSKNSGK